MNAIIADKKDINDVTFWNYFKNQNALFLAKDLIRAKQAENEKLVNNINDRLIDLGNAIVREVIPEIANPNKTVDNI